MELLFPLALLLAGRHGGWMTTFVLHISTASIPKAMVDKLLDKLPADEAERAGNMGWVERQAEFVVGRSLLRFGFERFAPHAREWQLATSEHGKPVLMEGQYESLSFSIAHTEGLVCCAFSTDAAIGLDVERVSRAGSIDRVKEKVFSSDELRGLDALEGDARDQRLLDLWTGKEAITKALGIGLGYDFRKLTMSFEAGMPRITNNPKLLKWKFERIAVAPDYCVVLASEKPLEAQWEAVTFEQLAVL